MLFEKAFSGVKGCGKRSTASLCWRAARDPALARQAVIKSRLVRLLSIQQAHLGSTVTNPQSVGRVVVRKGGATKPAAGLAPRVEVGEGREGRAWPAAG